MHGLQNPFHKFLTGFIRQVCLCLFIFFAIGNGSLYADEQKKSPPDRHEIVFLSACQIAELIRTRVITSTEVVEAYLDQIRRFNPALNAIVTLDEQGAMKRAMEADAALAKGTIWGPLHGVPVTIKDNYATRGLKTTNSLPDLADHVPKYDATMVKRLREAGAVILGKTNLPALAMDTQTNSPVFGVTNNPWDLKRTTGGSSGGDGAAVAAGLTALGIGNDIGGSIRIPSHFCGIYGIKPTENFTSIYGISPKVRNGDVRSVRHLSSCGPLARSVDDLKLCLSVMAGPDSRNPETPWVDLNEKPRKKLKDLHITWTDDFGGVPVTQDTKEAIRSFVTKLSENGCMVEKLSSTPFEPYVSSLGPEVKDLYDISRTDPETINFHEAWTTYGKLMDLELGYYQPSFFRLMSYVLGSWYRKDVPMITMVFPQSYDKYLKVLTRRDLFVSAMDSFLSSRDVLLCPVSSTPAYEHIKPWRYFGPFPVYNTPVMVDKKPVKYLVANMSYTCLFNLTGNPVVIIPIGYSRQGLPIGIQIVGKRWQDMELLTIAKQLDEISNAYRTPPGY